VFEGPMRRVQDDGRRRLVNLPRLDPHETVLDHVDPADAVQAAQPVQFVDQGQAPTLPSRGGGGRCPQADWYALLEGQLDDRGSGGGVVHRRGPSKCILGGVEESILPEPRLAGSPPPILTPTVPRLRLDPTWPI